MDLTHGRPRTSGAAHRRSVSPPPETTTPAPGIDRRWMDEALREAGAAGNRGEVPVGAVVVMDGRSIAAAGNASIAHHDPTAHAEVLALRAAGTSVRNYRLAGATLYVTVEPCLMCMGAIVHARIARLVYGCMDPKAGAAGSQFDLGADPRLNHVVAITSGIAEGECRALLQDFFRARRAP
jgi:tRNA(Arg) A34 adenosine deaminase TadA